MEHNTLHGNRHMLLMVLCCLIPVAALGFLNPIIAAAAMALSSLSVIVNSALLKRAKLKEGPA